MTDPDLSELPRTLMSASVPNEGEAPQHDFICVAGQGNDKDLIAKSVQPLCAMHCTQGDGHKLQWRVTPST